MTDIRNDIAEGNVWPYDQDEPEPEPVGVDADLVRTAYSWGLDELIYYVTDLEALIRWFALLYSYEYYDEDGNKIEAINDPIWTVYDDKGNYLAAADKLQETWNRVMHDG